MNIGVYTECLSKPYTGVEVQAHLIVDGLSKTKNEVTCFHSKNSKHPLFSNVNHHLFRKALPIPFYHRFAAFFHNRCFDNLDVLHLPYPQFPYLKKPKCPVVVTIHDLIPLFMPKFHNWKRAVYFKKFLPWYLRKVNAIIAVSESTKRDIVKYYGISENKITVVYDALPEIKYEKVEKEPFILYLGTLEPRKNVEGIIRAFALLKARGFKYKLVIAGGKGWKYNSIFSLVKKLRLQDDVIFRGYVSDAETVFLYKNAKLFVWPSFYEGFGLPVLEAMAYGTPVVASNNSSLPEVCGDAAVLVDPYDVHSIADGILEALDSNIYDVLVKRGLERAKLFTQRRMIDGIVDVYRGVVK